MDQNTNVTMESEKVIQGIIKNEKFISYDVDKKAVQNAGGNYLGDLAEIKIKGETLTGHLELDLFMKTSVSGDKISVMSIDDIYHREIFTYTGLTRIFDELQNKAKIPHEHRFKTVKLYGASDKQSAEVIIMENMTKKGFTTHDRFKCISLDFAEKAVSNLAKFHALSYAMKKLQSDKFQKIVSKVLAKYPITFNEVWKQFTLNMIDTVKSSANAPDLENRLDIFVEKMLQIFPGYHLPTKRSVICHGDYRANNLLIKEHDGQVIDLVAVDYQLIYHGCPLNDILYFIYGATSREFRKKHLENLLKLYRSTMKDFLKYFHIHIEDVYPAVEFNRDYNDKMEYGLMAMIQLLPTILAPEQDVPDFTETDASEIRIQSSPEFRERMKGILDDYVEFGIL